MFSTRVGEELDLVQSTVAATGFKGVSLRRGKYQVQIKENGKMRYLGLFDAADKAALCYARHIGAARAAAEAAEARREQPQPLTAAEARAAANAEGLELSPSVSSATGFQGVAKDGGTFKVSVYEDGRMRNLGHFRTPEEAALCYARYMAAVTRAGEALASAAAEELELVPSSAAATGFEGVYARESRYYAMAWEDGKQRYVYLGTFDTPQEAALCYARHVEAARSAAEATEARQRQTQPLTAAEARAAAAAEGLELVPSSGVTGFKGVKLNMGKWYQAQLREDGKKRHLGTFATPEEAALCYARHVRGTRVAARMAQPLIAAEASAAAAAEELKLVSSSSATGFRGVYNSRGRFVAKLVEDGKTRHLGMFATPEEAALCYARHTAHEQTRGKKRQQEQQELQQDERPGGDTQSHDWWLGPQQRPPPEPPQTVIIDGYAFRCYSTV